MNEDFLFDPWSGVDGHDPANLGSEEEGAPASLAKPSVLPDVGSATSPHRSISRAETGESPRWRPRPAASEQRQRGARRRSAEAPPSRILADPPPERVGASSGALSSVDRLRTLAIPLIGRIEPRLRAARHRTLLDDRLDAPDPCLRFRLIPWFGRIWLAPLADEPTWESKIEAAGAVEGWVETLVMDFIARSLRRV